MNKFTFFSLAFLTIFLTGCYFNENIYFNEDGSGKMRFGFDASEIMKMTDKGEKESNYGKDVDCTFVFKTVLDQKRDSILKLPKKEQQLLNILEPFSAHMLLDNEENKMVFEMFTNFKTADELKDMLMVLNTANNLKGDNETKIKDPDSPFLPFASGNNIELSYFFENGIFKKNIAIIDRETQKQLNDSLEKMAFMYASSKYKVEYHFPKRIKSISNDNAKFSVDGKTVFIEYGLMDYMTNPEIMNLEIVLED